MATTEILLAGFGGQGILFAGKILAYCGLMDNKELSWLPSYGPEMRGGTCNCSVCISDEPIGSPLVLTPDLLIVMNQPSFDKFVKDVRPGGKVFFDSSMMEANTDRTDISLFGIPSQQMADDMKKNGGFIPGVKPGRKTVEFFDDIMSKITLPGSIFLAIIAILPAIAVKFGVSSEFAQFYGGTSLLILVGVILDTLQQIESHLLMRHYDGLMKSGRIKGRTGRA